MSRGCDKMNSMGKELNEWVIKQYQAKGWSMRELARRANLNHGGVSSILSGKRPPSLVFYAGMARAFELPISVIEELDTDGKIPPDENERLSVSEWSLLLEQLSSAQRYELLKYGFELLRGSPDDENASDASGAKEAPQAT